MTAGPLGIVPAAGRATRLGEPAASKELLPVWRRDAASPPTPAIHCLLGSLEVAGVSEAIIAVRSGKEDIGASLGTTGPGGMRLAYVDVGETPSPAFTVLRALAGHEEREVALGFPDILFEPPGAVRALLDELAFRPSTDVLLGLFPHPVSRRADVVELEPGGAVGSVRRAGEPREGGLTWGLAAWRPGFTAFLKQSLENIDIEPPVGRSLDLGDILTRAIDSGLVIHGIVVSESPFLDIGTPDGLAEARRRLRQAPGQNR